MGEMVKPVKNAPLIFIHRPIDTVQINRLSEALRTKDWQTILNSERVSECYDSFVYHFNRLLALVLDEYAPIKKTNIPYRAVIRESWMMPGLMKSAKRRSILYRKAVGKARDSTYYIKYVTYRNHFNAIKRRARDSYFTVICWLNIKMTYVKPGKF